MFVHNQRSCNRHLTFQDRSSVTLGKAKSQHQSLNQDFVIFVP